MRYYPLLFGLILFFSCSISVSAQNEEALKELLGVLTLSEKQEVLDYSKQQETDIENEILAIFKRLPEESQIAIMEYAARLEMERTSPNTKPHNHENHAPAVNPNQPKTIMTFTETKYDFGTVKEGEKIRHTFKLRNTGGKPLIISNAQGSCGCTIPEWPREPIAPGASSEITVEFNSSKKTGIRDQRVTITANTNPATTVIRMTGEVIPKSEK